MTIKIGFICPTYKERELHSYTLRSLESFFQHTADGVAIVVDDASPNWGDDLLQDMQNLHRHPGQELHFSRSEEWRGLTYSWNKGLEIARDLKLDYVVCGNNDVVHTAKWYEGMLQALEQGYHLVGPLSNAAGITSHGHADVFRYVPNYEVTDDQLYLDSVADVLRTANSGLVIPCRVNGFYQMAKTAVWWAGSYNATTVYRPSNPFLSDGRANPTPLMTLNEDELQGRWLKKGWKLGVIPSSFIFHYRSVARGPQFRKGKWFRQT